MIAGGSSAEAKARLLIHNSVNIAVKMPAFVVPSRFSPGIFLAIELVGDVRVQPKLGATMPADRAVRGQGRVSLVQVPDGCVCQSAPLVYIIFK